MTLGKRSFSRFNDFQHNVARGRDTIGAAAPARGISIFARMAGALVFAAAGYPGIPLTQYTPEMRQHEYHGQILRAALHGFVRAQVGILDNWRDPQPANPSPWLPHPFPPRNWCKSAPP